jgi:hypothetical protein
MAANRQQADSHTGCTAESPRRSIRKRECHPCAARLRARADHQFAGVYPAFGWTRADDTTEPPIRLSHNRQWKISRAAVRGFDRDAEVLSLGGGDGQQPLTDDLPGGDGRPTLSESRTGHDGRSHQSRSDRLQLRHGELRTFNQRQHQTAAVNWHVNFWKGPGDANHPYLHPACTPASPIVNRSALISPETTLTFP